MATYPSNLPFFDMRAGYGEAAPGGILRTGMDAGPAKMRRRSSSVPSRFSGTTAPMSAAQLADFQEWVRASIAGGAISFTAAHPVTQAVTRFRFADASQPYSVTATGQGYAITAELEILS